jgi:AGZA family xanthine/uracil permease-like MFS transporter
MWIGIFCGGVLTVMLMLYRVKGAIIIGILLVSIISWPRPTSVTYFPYTETGNSAFDFFKQVVTFHPIGKILAVQQWNISEHAGQWGLAFITFLYVDILDCKLHVAEDPMLCTNIARHRYSILHGSFLWRHR